MGHNQPPPVPAQPNACLVTGATSGIGEATATALAATGAHVLLTARTIERGDAACSRILRRVPDARLSVLVADLADMNEVRALADQVTGRCGGLDVLVLNAGVARRRRELTAEGFEVDFATNHLAPFLLTQLLYKLLCASAPARVVTVSSSTHRHVKSLDLAALVTGENFHPLRTYSATKLMTVMFTIELARRLAGTGVIANIADPGFVRTALSRDASGAFALFLKLVRPFQLSPDKAAATSVYLATAAQLADTSGRYFTNCRASAPSALARDSAAAQRLWTLSTRLVTQNVGP